MSKQRQTLGRWGEAKAAEYLEGLGYEILRRNARTPYGEIDLIARQSSVLVFVEVKTRRTRSFGWPEEAVTPQKWEHLISSAEDLLQRELGWDGDWRFDVIAVETHSREAEPQITHYEHAFTGS